MEVFKPGSRDSFSLYIPRLDVARVCMISIVCDAAHYTEDFCMVDYRSDQTEA
jgi:hypothetical protein